MSRLPYLAARSGGCLVTHAARNAVPSLADPPARAVLPAVRPSPRAFASDALAALTHDAFGRIGHDVAHILPPVRTEGGVP